MLFADLNLNPKILAALNKCGYTTPTPVQRQTIPSILGGRDVIATAQTGTGKTAAFVLPVLHQLLDRPKQISPQVLILAPVRELAAQIDTAIRKYSLGTGLRVVNVFGGMPYHAQRQQLGKPYDILVATPGRLIDYLEKGSIDLSQIKFFVLDEADRMLDMGFFEDVKVIADYLPAKRQTLLFTATLDDRVNKLAHKLLHAPEIITVKAETVTLEKIEQRIYFADHVDHKLRMLQHLLQTESIFKAIIFVATKHYADKLSYQLRDWGFSVGVIHGDIKQQKRNRILQDFRAGKIDILIATDVAARGIDVADITHVFNFDISRSAEDYVHRIGRTGRAGKAGIAISFVLPNEGEKLKQIERYIESQIAEETIPGLEPQRKANRNEKAQDKKSQKRNKHRRGERRHPHQNERKRDFPPQERHSDKKKKFKGKTFAKRHDGKKNYDEQKSHDGNESYGEKKSHYGKKSYGEKRSHYGKESYGERKSHDRKEGYGERKSHDGKEGYGEKKNHYGKKSYDEKKTHDGKRSYSARRNHDEFSAGEKPFHKKNKSSKPKHFHDNDQRRRRDEHPEHAKKRENRSDDFRREKTRDGHRAVFKKGAKPRFSKHKKSSHPKKSFNND